MRQLITTPAQVGEILRQRRKSRKKPQGEMAAKLGLSQGRISTLEANPEKLTLDRLLALANLLGLEIVLQDKGEAPPPSTEW